MSVLPATVAVNAICEPSGEKYGSISTPCVEVNRRACPPLRPTTQRSPADSKARTLILELNLLKLESYSKLTFTPRQHLLQRAERKIGVCGGCFDGRRVPAIEEVEKLEQHLQFGPLAKIEALGESKIKVNV